MSPIGSATYYQKARFPPNNINWPTAVEQVNTDEGMEVCETRNANPAISRVIIGHLQRQYARLKAELRRAYETIQKLKDVLAETGDHRQYGFLMGYDVEAETLCDDQEMADAAPSAYSNKHIVALRQRNEAQQVALGKASQAIRQLNEAISRATDNGQLEIPPSDHTEGNASNIIRDKEMMDVSAQISADKSALEMSSRPRYRQ